jgi:pyridoxal/pyridoxine/pyridoxamine kinase
MLIPSLGYIPGGEALSAVLSLAKKLREKRPELVYLLDRESLFLPTPDMN